MNRQPSEMIKLPPTPKDLTRHRLTKPHELLMVIMVGLPARGKSFLSRKLERFLFWRGEQVRIFNVGERRRTHSSSGSHDASFFGEGNRDVREHIAQGVLSEAIRWLKYGDDGPSPTASKEASPPAPERRALALARGRSGSVSESDEDPSQRRPNRTAIFDATNSSMMRRRAVAETMAKELPSCRVVFVESVCDDEAVIERNLRQKVAMSPDYRAMPFDDAIADLRQRIAKYESQYESLSTRERLSFIKLFNLSSQLHINLIYGTIAKSLVPYLMGINISRRPLWLVRAAHCTGTPPSTPTADRQSTTVVVTRNAPLSAEGLAFAQRLGRFVARRCAEFAASELAETPSPSCSASLDLTEGSAAAHLAAMDLAAAAAASSPTSSGADADPHGGGAVCTVFTSTLPRSIQTADYCNCRDGRPQTTSALNPLDRGIAYGWTEEQFEARLPDECAKWRADVRHTRFPGGESFSDLFQRIEPLLIELEQQTAPVLIVGHLSVLQALASYFTGATLEEALKSSIPHHTVLQLTPSSHSMMWERELIPLTTDEPD